MDPASTKRIVSGIQTNVTFADTAANLKRMLEWLSKPELKDSDLIVFPECMLSGYCFATLEEAVKHAQLLDGEAVLAIADWCYRNGKYVALDRKSVV